MARIGTIISRPLKKSGTSGGVETAHPIGGAGTPDDPLTLALDKTINGGNNAAVLTEEGLYIDPDAISHPQGILVRDGFGIELGYLLPL